MSDAPFGYTKKGTPRKYPAGKSPWAGKKQPKSMIQKRIATKKRIYEAGKIALAGLADPPNAPVIKTRPVQKALALEVEGVTLNIDGLWVKLDQKGGCEIQGQQLDSRKAAILGTTLVSNATRKALTAG